MARRVLMLLVLAAALAACDRSAGRARGGVAADPYETLSLIRAKGPIPAKDFTVPALAGRPLSLGDFRQKVVLLNFWATWCPPCREEMPAMERLYQRYKDRGLAILAISVDTNVDAVKPFVDSFRLTFPIGLDPGSAVANAYEMRALPTTFLIDRTGHIVAAAMGARDWDSDAARAVIEALLR